MIRKKDLVKQLDQSVSITRNWRKGLTVILICALLLAIVGAGAHKLGAKLRQSSPTDLFTKPNSAPLPSTTPIQQLSLTPPIAASRADPTVGWKEFNSTDPDFGVTTTLSLPPGFSFHFTGSEFLIQKVSDETELWDYSTSVYRDSNGVLKNHYSGGSRRNWYETYLSAKQSNVQYKNRIVSVTEAPINGTSYLAIFVEAPTFNNRGESAGIKIGTHFVYVQNDIVHILMPYSEEAYASTAQIPKYIGAIFASLKSSQTK